LKHCVELDSPVQIFEFGSGDSDGDDHAGVAKRRGRSLCWLLRGRRGCDGAGSRGVKADGKEGGDGAAKLVEIVGRRRKKRSGRRNIVRCLLNVVIKLGSLLHLVWDKHISTRSLSWAQNSCG